VALGATIFVEIVPIGDGSLIRGKGQRYLRLWQTDS